MPNEIRQLLAVTEITTIGQLCHILNSISPYIDGWSLTAPIPEMELRRLAGIRARKAEYKTFAIPKKSGGERLISAPSGRLKAVQSAMNLLLQSIFTPSEYATGFVPDRNIRDNAAVHVGQTCLLNMDIEDFFPSIDKGMLRRALNRELGSRLSNEVINAICRLCTLPTVNGMEVLPQGAPTSPVLSNIVLKPFDEDMSRLAIQLGCRYSRYADDITFSHSHPVRKFFPGTLEAIEGRVGRHGFRVNPRKTCVQKAGEWMEVTGVVVSGKTNVPRDYVRQLRVLLHLWEKRGYAEAQGIFARDFSGGERQLANVVDGKLNYLRMIKGAGDSTYRKMKSRYTLLEKQLHREAKS